MAPSPRKRGLGVNGRRLKEAREARGLTQPQLAVKARCGLSGISQAENGHKDMTVAVFRRLCLALDVSSDYLLDLSDAQARRK